MRLSGQKSSVVWVVAALALVGGSLASAAPAAPQSSDRASAAAWKRVPAARGAPARGLKPTVEPKRFAAYDLDRVALGSVLDAAPAERSRTARPAGLVVSLPDPEGGFERFAVVESPVMESGLAARHPELRTYAGRGLDEPTAQVRFDLTPLGLHASVRSAKRSWFIDPRYEGDDTGHVAYARSDLADPRTVPFDERELAGAVSARAPIAARPAPGEPVSLRTYRLALVSDPSYAENSPGETTAAKVVLMNRVNQIYEADLAVRMVLIEATDKLNLDTDALATLPGGPCGAAACFTPEQLANCTGALLSRNSIVAGQLARARNFDIGHIVLGKDGGGIAGLGIVGKSRKAQGCTGISRPVGDFFAVDYVAHEMGHQFSGNHPFNGVQGNCSLSNRNGQTSTEPGSGSSVMAYAGICDQDDLQAHSDPYFSQRSMDEITAYAESAPTTTSSVQRVSLTGFDGSDSFRLTYGTQRSAPIVRGTNYNPVGIKAAIEQIPAFPAGGSVTVTSFGGGPTLDDTGFTVTFGGSLANTAVELLGLDAPVGVTGYVGETVAGGPSQNAGAISSTANRAPGVTTAAPLSIPARTPFQLTATGSDIDGDPLTYLWEQNDDGDPAIGTALVDNVKTNGPLFRIFGVAARYSDEAAYASPSLGQNLATSDPARSFPDVQQVLAGNTNAATGSCPTVRRPVVGPTGAVITPGDPVPDPVQDCFSEFLPTAAYTGVDRTRTLHFRVTVRDNRSGEGGTGFADTALTVASAAGPFRITSQSGRATAMAGTLLPVTWDVAGTSAAPVSTTSVRILLSTDGGRSFDRTLAAETPNDGAEQVALPPGLTTAAGRIRIEAVGNVFFDLSRGELQIVPATPSPAPTEPAGPTGATGTPPADSASVAPAPADSPAPATSSPGAGVGAPAGPAGPTAARVPSPPPTALELARREAGGRRVVLIGTVGSVRLYATTRSTVLGRPPRARRLLIAVCLARPCSVGSQVALRTTSRGGKAAVRRFALKSLKLPAGAAGSIVLRTSALDRRRARVSRSARAVLTVRAGGKRFARGYRFRTG